MDVAALTPQASLADMWALSTLHNVASELGRRHRSAGPALASAGTHRRTPGARNARLEALRRLASDPGATDAERDLASARIARFENQMG